MARIVVLGAGLIGKFVASRLVEHDLLVVDNCQESLNELSCQTLCCSAFDVLDMEDLHYKDLCSDPDFRYWEYSNCKEMVLAIEKWGEER